MKSKLIAITLTLIMTMTVMSVPAMAAEGDASKVVGEENQTTAAAITKVSELEAASIKYNSATLTWSALGENVSKYVIYKATSENGPFTKLDEVSGDETSYVAKALDTGKTVYFKVVPVLNNGNKVSLANGEDKTVEDSEAIEVTPQLEKPEVAGQAMSRISVKVSWNKVAGAKGYILYKRSDTGYKRVKTFTSSTKSYTQKKLTAGTTHRYIVRAYRTNAGITAKTNSNAINIKTPKKLTMKTAGFWNTNAGKVIKVAQTKKGKPYVWGSSGPNSFDCSGFVSWTMKKVGKKTTGVSVSRQSSRTFYSVYNKKYGLGRNLKDAQPGDIIIMGYGGSARSIFHVGMYYDNGKYIHATTGGRGVTISKIPKSMVVAIIRLPGLE